MHTLTEFALYMFALAVTLILSYNMMHFFISVYFIDTFGSNTYSKPPLVVIFDGVSKLQNALLQFSRALNTLNTYNKLKMSPFPDIASFFRNLCKFLVESNSFIAFSITIVLVLVLSFLLLFLVYVAYFYRHCLCIGKDFIAISNVLLIYYF